MGNRRQVLFPSLETGAAVLSKDWKLAECRALGEPPVARAPRRGKAPLAKRAGVCHNDSQTY